MALERTKSISRTAGVHHRVGVLLTLPLICLRQRAYHLAEELVYYPALNCTEDI